ncbi:MAG: hypothetical protein QXI43_00150 [Candidatus Nitrosocaldus sp.]
MRLCECFLSKYCPSSSSSSSPSSYQAYIDKAGNGYDGILTIFKDGEVIIHEEVRAGYYFYIEHLLYCVECRDKIGVTIDDLRHEFR